MPASNKPKPDPKPLAPVYNSQIAEREAAEAAEQRAAEQAERDDPTTEAHRLAVANGAQGLTHDPRPRTMPTPDFYTDTGAQNYIKNRNPHPAGPGLFLSELVAAAEADPASVEKLAAVVQEICRMIRHDDIASKSKGLPH